MRSLPSKLPPGSGLIRVLASPNSSRPSFTDLAFSYPLKLIVPSRHLQDGIACVYLISYGGGLVGGDIVRLEIDVGRDTGLVVLTQGSTKVFRTRRLHTAPALDAATASAPPLPPPLSPPTLQYIHASIQTGATLYLLPSPVTCFARSNYSQTQKFILEDSTSSLLLLDWFNSGRMAMQGEAGDGIGEEWQFTRYRSANSIYRGGKLIANDVLLLEDDPNSTLPLPRPTSYAPSVLPYSIYLTLHLFGPKMSPLRTHIRAVFSNIVHYQIKTPYSVIWSYSDLPLEGGDGGIVRGCASGTEELKDWLVGLLHGAGIVESMGEDLWKLSFA